MIHAPGDRQALNQRFVECGTTYGNPGRPPTDGAIPHCERVVIAFARIIHLTLGIDGAIDAHGGWPTAFVTESEESKSPKPFE